MHVLALLSIGLLALRCVDTLAPLFMGLLFSFFDLLIIGVGARRTGGRLRLTAYQHQQSRRLHH